MWVNVCCACGQPDLNSADAFRLGPWECSHCPCRFFAVHALSERTAASDADGPTSRTRGLPAPGPVIAFNEPL